MTLARRLRKLEVVVPPISRGKPLPEDPVAFARALVAGEFSPEDIDPTHPEHMGWACRVHAFLITLSPEHQQWLRTQRELFPGSYPGELLLPATDAEVLVRMDEVMRRGVSGWRIARKKEMMRLSSWLRKLEAAVPECDEGIQYLTRPDHASSEADCCTRCGGCNVR